MIVASKKLNLCKSDLEIAKRKVSINAYFNWIEMCFVSPEMKTSCPCCIKVLIALWTWQSVAHIILQYAELKLQARLLDLEELYYKINVRLNATVNTWLSAEGHNGLTL